MTSQTEPHQGADSLECLYKTQEDLYRYWLELGGTADWQQAITPEGLSKSLANCRVKKVNAAIKEGNWIHEVVMVDEKEITGFVSAVLSRLPKLRKLRLYACKTFAPFDFEVIDAVPDAFPKLEHIGLIRSMWTEELVSELTSRFPELRRSFKYLSRGCGVGVYRENGPTQDAVELKKILKRNKKLQMLD